MRVSISDISMKILSRQSPLALIQVIEVMRLFPDLKFDIVAVESYGDQHQEISLSSNPPTDFFTRELDAALISGQGDIAIHSAKDLPYPLPQGLSVIALIGPEDQSDSLVSRGQLSLKELPFGAKVGTSSFSRQQSIFKYRPDVSIIDIRGNIQQRLALVDQGEVDAIVVATCALLRLGLESRITQRLSFDTHPLQGYIAVVSRTDNQTMASLFMPVDVRQTWGKVTLVGAGPGASDLITIRGKKVVDAAAVVLFDDLLNETILSETRAECIYVGKRKGHHALEQKDIEELMAQQALSGRSVCRLKGGDPFIFGRGGEELEYLSSRLIEVEIVPGVTSALAAAAEAKIPLTKRGISSSVAFLTGHPASSLTVPNADTLVYYMGASVLKDIAEKVLESGRSDSTPVAIVHQAASPTRSVLLTTIANILEGLIEAESPSIIIIGKVAHG